MSLVQRQFKYKEYMQFPRTGDDCEHTDVNDPFFLSRGWARSQICMMIKGYYGIGIDTMKYCLTTSVSDAQDLIFYTMDTFSRRMFRQPSIPEFIRFFEWLDAYGSQSTKDKVEDYITNSNEHKYIDSCLTTFLSWSAGWPSKADGALNVRYYGPIGTSGYAVACKNMVRALSALPTVRLQFVPMSIQNMDLSDNGPDNTAFASACPFSVQKLYAGAAWEWGSLPAPDIVIIHSVPTMWIPIAIREKQFSATVLLIGVTVWETDAIPRPWIPYLQWVDYVTFPNEWNAAVFRQAVPDLKTDFIPHPVTPLPVVAVGDAVAPELVSLISDKQANSNLYVFYTINEFSGRKGIDTLLRSYINSFKATDQVVLFVKTGGDVPQQTAQQYILKLAANNPYPPRIVLDYTRWSDSDIAVLHEVGDCFVSLTRAEGQGMGACAAGLAGKAVIMTDYGGQKDYLKGIHYVPYELVPATYCLPFDPQHANCLALPSCRRFPNFHPYDQRWGLADERAAEGALWQAYAEKWTGVSQTVDYITQQFSPAVVAARFESFMRSKFAASGDRVFFPSSLPDSFDQPEEYFQPQSQVLPLNMVTEFRYPVRGTRPVVVVIGCSGFGDFGDDLYAAMHKVYLGQDYDVYVCNTRSFVYKDGNLRFATDYASSEDLLSFDYLLIGGGSIVNSAELKSTIFTIYFPFCQANNIPVSVVSVGCGYDTSVASPVLSQDVLDAWTPLLNYANFITVQSVRDYETLAPLVTIKRRFRLQTRPDLAYGADEAFPATRPPKQKDCVIFCPGGVVTMQHEDIALRLQTLTWESKYLQSSLVFMPLDGMRDTTYPTAKTQAELDRVKAQFPKAVIFQGRFYNGPFLKLMGLQDPSNASVMTVGAVVDIFRNAKAVVTGKYHGLVLGRLFGLEVDDSRSGLQRLTDEQLTPLSKGRWRDSYCFVKNDIDLQCLATADARGMCDKEPDDWTDADRNTAIVDLCTQDQKVLSAPSLEYAQSYTNLQLWYLQRSRLAQILAPAHCDNRLPV